MLFIIVSAKWTTLTNPSAYRKRWQSYGSWGYNYTSLFWNFSNLFEQKIKKNSLKRICDPDWFFFFVFFKEWKKWIHFYKLLSSLLERWKMKKISFKTYWWKVIKRRSKLKERWRIKGMLWCCWFLLYSKLILL